jgi:hypothetical protein
VCVCVCVVRMVLLTNHCVLICSLVPLLISRYVRCVVSAYMLSALFEGGLVLVGVPVYVGLSGPMTE